MLSERVEKLRKCVKNCTVNDFTSKIISFSGEKGSWVILCDLMETSIKSHLQNVCDCRSAPLTV